MGLFRGRGRGHARPSREQTKRAFDQLEQWASTRRGVEAYLEPETVVTSPTVVLVAHDGEWTRRRIGKPDDAHDLGKRLGIPVYDTAKTGYPPRMRAYSSRRARELRRQGLAD